MSAATEPINAAINERNAANAQFSTGPTSSAGKERVKFNALKTGLFARTIVLPGEQQSNYEALGAYLVDEYLPQSDAERELVTTIQTTTWRLSRAVEMESALFAIVAQQHFDSTCEQFSNLSPEACYPLARAAGYMANARAFDQLNRQEGRLQRVLDRAMRDLKSLIASRVPPPEPAQQAAEPTPKPEQSTAEPTPSGFVPRKFPKNMPSFSGPQAKEHRRAWLRKNASTNMA
jgi:hypothetical protein